MDPREHLAQTPCVEEMEARDAPKGKVTCPRLAFIPSSGMVGPYNMIPLEQGFLPPQGVCKDQRKGFITDFHPYSGPTHALFSDLALCQPTSPLQGPQIDQLGIWLEVGGDRGWVREVKEA